jgi:hypothetical protein
MERDQTVLSDQELAALKAEAARYRELDRHSVISISNLDTLLAQLIEARRERDEFALQVATERGWKNIANASTRKAEQFERERNEAREALRGAIRLYVPANSGNLPRWRRALGEEA